MATFLLLRPFSVLVAGQVIMRTMAVRVAVYAMMGSIQTQRRTSVRTAQQEPKRVPPTSFALLVIPATILLQVPRSAISALQDPSARQIDPHVKAAPLEQFLQLQVLVVRPLLLARFRITTVRIARIAMRELTSQLLGIQLAMLVKLAAIHHRQAPQYVQIAPLADFRTILEQQAKMIAKNALGLPHCSKDPKAVPTAFCRITTSRLSALSVNLA